jgi:hypothetical protein
MSLRTETTIKGATSISTVQNWQGLQEDASGVVTPMDSGLALTAFPFHLPGAVLLYLLNASDRSLQLISDTETDSHLIHIQSESQAVDPTLTALTLQNWYFDSRTGLPSRVDYASPDPANPNRSGIASVVFLSWRKTPSTLVPQSIQLLQNGALVATVNVEPPQYNQGLTKAIFNLP